MSIIFFECLEPVSVKKLSSTTNKKIFVGVEYNLAVFLNIAFIFFSYPLLVFCLNN